MASVRSGRDFEGPTRPENPAESESKPWRSRRRLRKQPPQRNIDEFWAKFTTKTPGKAFTILPDNLYAKRRASHAPKGEIRGTNAIDSYEEAVRICKTKVDKISRECRRVNQKYRDPHFDIEFDFNRCQAARQQRKERPSDCLMGLADTETESNLHPQAVKRVEDIFKKPQFYIDRATANDVRQGHDANCWFMSALSTLSNKEGLIEKVCVAWDENVGVYGFVFHRDGEWISEVIDDKLYLCKPDYDDKTLDQERWLQVDHRKNPEEEYRSVMQTGSRALYFAQCSDENETWLPLLEKAYAKAHGDFKAIEGGFVGEGIEDLTGGVTTEFFTTDILDKDKFWREELMNVNKSFLFGCGSTAKGLHGQNKGIVEKHAYSIMEAVEPDGVRLLKLRNPWGKIEWTGPWSDGSEEWTPDWMIKLKHKFGNDGVFWISYEDLLHHYQHFDRTRLFGDEWTMTQQWTSLNIPWSVDYHDTKFRITLTKSSPAVIVLSQLDERYFRGLEGQYEFQLSFRLHKDKDNDDDYIVRSHGNYFMRRSVSVELDLDAGNYSVLLKIIAKRRNRKTPEEVLQETCLTRREKLLRIGLSYDLAHAKGQFKDYEMEKQKQEKAKKKAERKEKHEAGRRRRRKEKLKKQKREERLRQKNIEEATPDATNLVSNLTQAQEQLRGLGIVDSTQGESQAFEVRVVRPSQRTESRPRSLSREHRRSFSGDGNFGGGRGGYNASPSKLQQVSTPLELQLRNEEVSRGRHNGSPKLVGQDPVSEGEGGYGGGRGGYNATMSPPRVQSSPSLLQAFAERDVGRGGSNDTTAVQEQRMSSGPEGGFGGGRGGYNASPAEPQDSVLIEDRSAGGEGGGYGGGRGGYNTGRGGYNITPEEATTEKPATNVRGLPEPGPSSKPHASTGNKPVPNPAHMTPRLQVNGADARSHVSDSDASDDDLSWDSELDDSDEEDDHDAEAQYGYESDDDEFARDPWNAVCVVGLRVYSKDAQVKIQVVRPEGEKHEGKLDVDDAAADATVTPRVKRNRSPSPMRNVGGHPASKEGSYQG